MKPLRRLLGSSAFCVLLLLIVNVAFPGVLHRAASATEPTYQLLANPGMEYFDAPYGQFHGVNCQVASGWHRFSLTGPAPCWMDTRVFAYSDLGGDWVERIQGETSQMIVSTQPYTAGLWQTVTGLTPGVGYGFHAALLTIFQTSAGEPNPDTMIKQVGIDPTGGTDPSAPTVVWSEQDAHDLGPWSIDLRTQVWATTDRATVFIRVISPYDAGPWPFMNQSFLDSAILAQTPEISASSPAETASPTFLVRWSGATAAPGAVKLRWYDVQWLDEAEGIWHDWLTRIGLDQVQASFTGERGHAYRFRARVWQKYENGAHLVSPYRPDGDTRTFVQGSRLVGQVLTNEGHPVVGATVSISGTGYSAMSGPGGYYDIWLVPSADPRSITVEAPGWLAPAPVHGVVFGPTTTISLDWTLRPPDDSVQNGGFETGLDGWSIPDGQEGQPSWVAAPVHTGLGAVALAGTTIMSQTGTLAGSWEPALAFWYRPAGADPAGDLFRVLVTVATGPSSRAPAPGVEPGSGAGFAGLEGMAGARTYTITPSLEVADWQLVSLKLASEEYLTATVTVQFEMSEDGEGTATTVTLDEVSVGKTPGGPYKSYLSLIGRGE